MTLHLLPFLSLHALPLNIVKKQLLPPPCLVVFTNLTPLWAATLWKYMLARSSWAPGWPLERTVIGSSVFPSCPAITVQSHVTQNMLNTKHLPYSTLNVGHLIKCGYETTSKQFMELPFLYQICSVLIQTATLALLLWIKRWQKCILTLYCHVWQRAWFF